MAPRPIWSGTISFGLVSIPVRMVTATSSRELRFHFVDRRDLQPIGYDKVRKDTGEHVDEENVARAFELEDGRYVPIDPEDLDRLDVELTHSVDICDFVALDEIDPIFFRQAYYLVPQVGGEKPYRLLVQALEETGRVGIAKVVIRNKQHLACLRPHENVLVLETMYYADEVRRPEDVAGDVAETDGLRKAEIEMAKFARREPQRGLRPGALRRHLPCRAARAHPRQGGGPAAAGAAGGRGGGRGSHAGATRVGRAHATRTR